MKISQGLLNSIANKFKAGTGAASYALQETRVTTANLETNMAKVLSAAPSAELSAQDLVVASLNAIFADGEPKAYDNLAAVLAAKVEGTKTLLEVFTEPCERHYKNEVVTLLQELYNRSPQSIAKIAQSLSAGLKSSLARIQELHGELADQLRLRVTGILNSTSPVN